MDRELQADQICDRLRRELPALRDRYRVASLSLFGSFVRGEQRPDSDVDLLVSFDQKPGLIRFIELEQRLGDLIGRKVDLVLRDALRPQVAVAALAEELPL